MIERKKAEDKEELDRIKAEDDAREAQRQQRKLEFLLTQTELFNHFIGAKMGILPPEAKPPAAAVAEKADGAAASGDGDGDGDGDEFVPPPVDAELQSEAMEATKAHIRATRDSARAFDMRDGEGM